MAEVYFKDPRLEMTGAARLTLRIIFYSGYGVMTAAAVSLLLSDVALLRSIGLLLALFLLDRLVHAGKPDRSLIHLPADGQANLGDYLTPSAFHLLERGFDRALWTGGDLTLHLADRLIDRKEIKIGLKRLDVKAEEMESKIVEYLKAADAAKNTKEGLLRQATDIVYIAYRHAAGNREDRIGAKDLFSALSEIESESITRLFKIFEIEKGDLENALLYSRFKKTFGGLRRLPSSLSGFAARPLRVQHRVMNRAWTARPTPFLDQFSEDVTDLARTERAGFLIGHDQEYDRMVDVLSRPGNPNVLLVGKPGSGKSSLVAHLAYRIVNDRVPPPLFDRRLVSLEIGRIVAGAAEGELQERVKKIIDEIVRAGNIILYIPDVHNLLRTSGQMRLSASDILMPAIKSAAFSVIGATYPREYKQYIEPNNDFASVFEAIRIQEINEDQAIKFLTYDSMILEGQYKLTISFSAIKRAVTLAHKYFRQKLLPMSAEDLLKEALADVSEKGREFLSGDDVLAIAQRKINIPLGEVGKSEAEKLLNLEDAIHQRLIDQEEAVRAVARALREYRSGLSRKGGSIANFLFVGPTGVGKTELSKILAKIQFGSGEAMIRFDMSEYQTRESIYRFIGSPDGSTSGALTDAVLEKPYSLILLDEFEKANGDILNLFLQVFDDGRLTDNLSRTVDFQNTIIIATSNAKSDFIKTELENGKIMKDVAEELKKKLTDVFRPELLNRFSGIIVFRNLLPEHIKAIAAIQLKDLAVTVAEQGITLNFEDSAVSKIAELGYDPVFGARPLRNVISEKLRGALAEKILKGELVKGSSVKVVFQKGDFNFI